MLSHIKAPRGANKRPKRVGRGESSGHGKTCCRGGKGQTARKGNSKPRLGFEGGQMPMYRRVPKRGFFNWMRENEVAIVNLGDLNKRFKDGDVVSVEQLKKVGLIHSSNRVKVLGNGEFGKKLTVQVQQFSKSAKQKLESLGGKAEIIQ